MGRPDFFKHRAWLHVAGLSFPVWFNLPSLPGTPYILPQIAQFVNAFFLPLNAYPQKSLGGAWHPRFTSQVGENS
jgi:hypothetical protein